MRRIERSGVGPQAASGRAAGGRHPRSRTIPPFIVVCLTTMVLLAASTVAAALIAPYPPTQQRLTARLLPPAFLGGDPRYLLGTDHLGRDVLSRTLHGLRVVFVVATLATLLGTMLGTALGLLSGYLGGSIDTVVMFLVDSQASLPFTVLALAGVAFFGTSTAVLILVIGFAGWDGYARLIRGQVLTITPRPFVEAAVALGARAPRVIARHIVPNIVSPLTVLATVNFAAIVLLESGLSFLGLGVQPPYPSLGNQLADGRDYMATAWWLVAVPGIVLTWITIAVSALGDWVRDRFDPIPSAR